MSRPIGTAAELERRRRLAVRRLDEGEPAAVVARILGVPRSTVYRWRQLARRRPDGLAAAPAPGPDPRLSDADLRRLDGLLRQGARRHGWPNQLWTGPRVAEVVRRHFGVVLHPDHLVRLLRRRLGWTSQKPARRAREQDADEVARWKAVEFPRLARAARARGAHLAFLDEAGFMLTPVARRTLAPRGETPVLDCLDRRDRVSAISCITLSPKRAKPGLAFRLLEPNTNVRAKDVVSFLRQLRRTLGGPLTVVWDRSMLHSRSTLVRGYLAGHPDVVVEDFPGYAPQLNPDELVWSWAKYGRLGNWAPTDADELWDGVHGALYDLRQQPELLRSFIDHVKLPLLL